MHPYPHTYVVNASGVAEGPVSVSADNLPALSTAPPAEFDGPGDLWSPETLLCAAVANCFILTFRSLSRAVSLRWQHLSCRVVGTLERGERGAQFTHFVTHAELEVAPQTDLELCRKLLEQAEHGCLIANSLRGHRSLRTRIAERDRAFG